jgi:hypothetical protein
MWTGPAQVDGAVDAFRSRVKDSSEPARQASDAATASRTASTLHAKKQLERLELGAGLALTAVAAVLHVTFLLRAGGLWRDEVVSFNVAAQPTLAQMHEAVRYDSFPNLFHLVLRGWLSVGGGSSDIATRGLGLVIGLCVLGSFWWNARVFGSRIPLFSLLFLGVSGLCVRTIDAVRAYGLGILCISIAFGALWQVATRPSLRNVLLATGAALLSVQALYQNAFLLGAICLAAALVCARQGLWRRVALILGIGLCAALSLSLYLGAMQHMSEIKPLIAARAGLGRILAVAVLALRDGSNGRLCLWLCLLGGYVALTVRSLRGLGPQREGSEDLVAYTLASVAIAVGGFLVWLQVLGFPTQPWYYVPPMTLLCLAADAAWPVLLDAERAARWRVYAVAGGGLLGLLGAYSAVTVRQTNVDLLAARLGQMVQPGDFILVDQWYNGASFSRYFTGPTQWTTLPPLADQSLQRLDLFKQFMVAPQPTAWVERQMADTLKAGHKVWLAGGLPLSTKDKPAPELPPAPNSAVGWDHDAYSYVWARHAAELLQRRAGKAGRVEIALEGPVSEYENLPLWVVQGWRETAKSK